MGNRAVITTEDKKIGVYLHWNGGRDSVEAFLQYCKLKGYGAPEQDCYGWARLCQVVGNFFGGSTSIGIDILENLDCDNFDNGLYIIKNWEIVGREFTRGCEQYEYDLNEMLIGINERQPEKEQIPKEYFEAVKVAVEDLEIGDRVFMNVFDNIKLHTIVGIGQDDIVNGRKVNGIPYVDLYKNNDTYAWNTNNYLHEKEYMVIK